MTPHAENSHLLRDAALGGVEVTRIVDWQREYAPHTHDALMIGLPETGVLGFRRERAHFRSPPRSITVVNPGDLHTGYPASDESLVYRALYIPVSFIFRALDQPDTGALPQFPGGVIENDPHTFRLLCRAHQSIVAADPPLGRESRLAEAVHRLYARHATPARIPRSGAEPVVVGRIKAIIEENPDGTIAVADLAAQVGLSPWHLMRTFRDQTGVPIYAYMTQRRLARAKTMLLAGTAPAQVAAALGFADQAHFTKRFKQFVGVTPGQLDSIA